MDELGERPSDELLGRIAEHCGVGRVAGDVAPVEIGDRDPGRGVLEHPAEARLALGQRLLGALEILDVGVAAEPFADAAGGVAQGNGERAEPSVRSVVTLDAEFD